MIKFELSEEEAATLLDELNQLASYKWNDDTVHGSDCYSSILPVIESQIARSEP